MIILNIIKASPLFISDVSRIEAHQKRLIFGLVLSLGLNEVYFPAQVTKHFLRLSHVQNLVRKLRWDFMEE